MPGSGIRPAAEITTHMPETAVVSLTVSQDDADLFDAPRAGALGIADVTVRRHVSAILRKLRVGPAKTQSLLLDKARERERKGS
jgi:DNA-binding NarL/FixJ family response regulator